LSNFDASSSAQRGDVDPDNSECIFVQAFRQLREAPAKAFRSMIDSGQDKVFEVRLSPAVVSPLACKRDTSFFLFPRKPEASVVRRWAQAARGLTSASLACLSL
jgi:hypothetical protein